MSPSTLRDHSYANKPLLDLFPKITPYSTGYLDVDEQHQIYWEQSGNPDGVPILFLHGGPGGGATETHRRFFDPDYYRIIIFDQRGAGRSAPIGCLENNTPDLLVQDIEKLRTHLSIESWHIFGGSWGSTLALLYASRAPERCISLILRGIFLMESEEIDWFLYGMRTLFPEVWEEFAGHVPSNERNNLLNVYYDMLTDGDEATRMDAAIQWTLYESACSSLIPNFETITTEDQKNHAYALARIECHYFRNYAFSEATSLLSQIKIFRPIPAVIIQGRYDAVCPIQTAYKLHQLWPEADYIVVPDGGHSALDPAIRSRLIEATENAKTIQR